MQNSAVFERRGCNAVHRNYSFFIQTKTRPPLREGAFDLIVPDGLQGADANGAAGGNDAGKQAHHHGKADGS